MNMEESKNNTERQRSKTKTILTWVFVLAPVVAVFGIIFGYQLNPNNSVLKILWYTLWFAVLPALLIWSYKILTRSNSEVER